MHQHKKHSGPENRKQDLSFVRLSGEDSAGCAAFAAMIPAYMEELDRNAGRPYHPEWAPKWTRSMLNQQGPADRYLELCYAKDTLVGFFYGKVDHEDHRGAVRPGWGYIMEFYVLPQLRRRGYGKEMYARLEHLFRENGTARLYLTADPVTGAPFWKAIGFTATGERSPENGLELYEKDLS